MSWQVGLRGPTQGWSGLTRDYTRPKESVGTVGDTTQHRGCDGPVDRFISWVCVGSRGGGPHGGPMGSLGGMGVIMGRGWRNGDVIGGLAPTLPPIGPTGPKDTRGRGGSPRSHLGTLQETQLRDGAEESASLSPDPDLLPVAHSQ